LQAALGVAQVERIDDIVARKRWLGQAYTERLQGHRPVSSLDSDRRPASVHTTGDQTPRGTDCWAGNNGFKPARRWQQDVIGDTRSMIGVVMGNGHPSMATISNVCPSSCRSR